MQRDADRLLHVLEVRLAPGAGALAEIGAVRLDRHDGLRELASFDRRVRLDAEGAPDPDAVSLELALRSFLRFVGDEGAILAFEEAREPLARSFRAAGLGDALDPRRIDDAECPLAKALGVADRAALPARAGDGRDDALHAARAVGRSLRWLHARGRL